MTDQTTMCQGKRSHRMKYILFLCLISLIFLVTSGCSSKDDQAGGGDDAINEPSPSVEVAKGKPVKYRVMGSNDFQSFVKNWDSKVIWGHHTYFFTAIMATRDYSRGMARLAIRSCHGALPRG